MGRMRDGDGGAGRHLKTNWTGASWRALGRTGYVRGEEADNGGRVGSIAKKSHQTSQLHRGASEFAITSFCKVEK